MKSENFKRIKQSCYFTYLAMSSVFSLPALLFVTFHNMYNISYTLLGTLVLINFCTQLIIDLIFTFYAKHFNIKKTIRIMPLLTTIGLAIYAIIPMLFKDAAYLGLCIGTVIFSVAAGLCEVLLSPLIAAVPSKTPEKDMSFLHSLYAWGVLTVVIISTSFLKIFGAENWMYLTLFLAIFPLISCFLFCISEFPEVKIGENSFKSVSKKRGIGLVLCVACIFLGSASENVMTNWISGYIEKALHISKIYGDIFGMAVFAALLGFGRMLYTKYGGNISNVLLIGMLGAFVCYVFAGICTSVLLSFIACILTGFFTAMLWPGTLILMEEKIASPGITAYALMAAGGDLGASIAPQLMGVIVDAVEKSDMAKNLSIILSYQPEQLGMKVGMLVAAIFPLMGVFLLIGIKKYFSDKKIK